VGLLKSTSCKITTARITQLVIIVLCSVKCKLNENFTMRHRLFHIYNIQAVVILQEVDLRRPTQYSFVKMAKIGIGTLFKHFNFEIPRTLK
jgi:hypothetical protein